MIGWECPKCGKTYSPFVQQCPVCAIPETSWASSTNPVQPEAPEEPEIKPGMDVRDMSKQELIDLYHTACEGYASITAKLTDLQSRLSTLMGAAEAMSEKIDNHLTFNDAISYQELTSARAAFCALREGK